MDIKDFLSYLDGVKKTNGSSWQAKCPAHDDSNPSLSIGYDKKDDKILLHCHAGCTHKEILDVLGIDETELFHQDDDLDNLYTSFNGDKSIKKSREKTWTTLDLNDIKARPVSEDSQAMNYLKKRGFSESTIKNEDIMVDDEGNIMFLFYDRDEELCFVKYRPPHKISSNHNGPKYWQEEGGKPILFRQNRVDTDKPLCITEGQMDALALVESGIDNAVSIPGGAQDLKFLETTYDFINQFDNVIIWPDNDEPGLGFLDDFSTRIGKWRCSRVKSPYKDANIHLYKEGEESVRKAVERAEDMVGGILRVSEIEENDPRDEERIQSSLEEINKIAGGHGMGEVSVWTGKSGHGKSTFLLNEIATAIDQDYSVLLYNGEYKDSRVRYWSELIMAGESNIGVDTSGKYDVPYVEDDVRDHLREWYYDNYYMYDTRKGDNIHEILETFKYATGKYNVRLFVLDNLMKAVFASRQNGNWDRYKLQSELVGLLVDFAKNFNVHVMLVAHAHKVEENEVKDLTDISGHADIGNRVDAGYAVRKLESEDVGDDKDLRPEDDGTIRILKNRFIGPTGKRIVVNFDEQTKRFASRNAKHGQGLNKVYSWKDSFNN